MNIEVTMTETVTYANTYTVEEFAEILDCEPIEEVVRATLDDVSNRDSDYGIDGAEGLLDDVLEHFTAVTDRTWEITT